MSANIMSTVIDGVASFLTSPVVWLGCAGLLLIMLVVLPASPLRTVKKENNNE
ncbi:MULTISPECIES: hypothetical protein [Serratia]|uniref:hypothetical protein n=1 Tax=Serratia TaxID=613 RepID=UPI000744F90E|nr:MULTISPECIES: hypothetical protein [Serratia]MBH3293386.1 hypothetical protein [Serratia marcescens]MDR8481911.1 hypothetical protein [Serratia nevei]NMT26845.1 hypothetical protein [Serratia marcescens]CVG65291.1 Uncharacterised protein [Serratia marcescens]HEJ7047514.1 hypothetical protein [Serratia marcescens]